MGRARSKKVSYSRDLPTLSMFSMAQALTCSTTPALWSYSREKLMMDCSSSPLISALLAISSRNSVRNVFITPNLENDVLNN